MGLNFEFLIQRDTVGQRKNECQGMQSFLHTLILAVSMVRFCSSLIFFFLFADFFRSILLYAFIKNQSKKVRKTIQ